MSVNFFTPVSGKEVSSFSQMVDNYFYLGGKKAVVIPGHLDGDKKGIVFIKDSAPFLLTALKVISYLTVILPLIILVIKAIMRSSSSFYVIDLKKELGKGVDVPQKVVDEIQNQFEVIREQKDSDGIEWLRKGKSLVFKLESTPGLVFKIHAAEVHNLFSPNVKIGSGEDDPLKRRYGDTAYAEKIRLAHALDLLVIPRAKLFTIQTEKGPLTCWAEQELDFERDASQQEELYRTALPGSNETVRQMATLIANTSFRDVTWRNMPLLRETGTQKRVALIDLEVLFLQVTDGIYSGDGGSEGLINCLFTKEQINVAAKVANQFGVYTSGNEEVVARRLSEIEQEEKLQAFYRDKGIDKNPGQQIQVEDLSTLGLDLEEKKSLKKWDKEGSRVADTEWTMREAIEKVVRKINRQLEQSSDTASTKKKRTILFDGNQHGRLAQIGRRLIYRPDQKPTWLDRILNALEKQGHLFKITYRHPSHTAQA